ncbi:hypothetical protein L3Y34_013381 [Caenorhabditis briggsae]|uniref:Uncharacterized protein n=1 Tax=Caenorhabditis briggsae TaxID=6238 RepID=A0AAE8ZRK0_CAEBR|nr:hypothetical protein L3Y34_013381 [Caenorhabditis briggsae]
MASLHWSLYSKDSTHHRREEFSLMKHQSRISTTNSTMSMSSYRKWREDTTQNAVRKEFKFLEDNKRESPSLGLSLGILDFKSWMKQHQRWMQNPNRWCGKL